MFNFTLLCDNFVHKMALLKRNICHWKITPLILFNSTEFAVNLVASFPGFSKFIFAEFAIYLDWIYLALFTGFNWILLNFFLDFLNFWISRIFPNFIFGYPGFFLISFLGKIRIFINLADNDIFGIFLFFKLSFLSNLWSIRMIY